VATLLGPLLSLSGSALVGSADFVAGTATRQLPASVVAASGQAVGVPVLAIALTLTGSWAAPTASLWWAVAAGALSALSLSAFYLALARGPMGLVAPIVSAAVAVPVLSGLLHGDRPGALTTVGLLAIAAGLVIANSPDLPGSGGVHVIARRPTALAAKLVAPTTALSAVAALGFGLVYVLLARAAGGGAGMAVLTFRTTSLTLLTLWLLIRRTPDLPTRRQLAVLGAVGTADVAAGTAYAAAATASGALLTINSLLYNTYPLVTLALSHLIRHETLTRRQQVASAATLAGALLVLAD
jgi:drug/metabolite transporter (DMT)-like permease